ncbi:hypothetical protein KGQ71_04940, partial [Patescibacteria group bacterium]|nr:hypothetical protein [Patescibacteria group bacterium]
MKLFVWDFHGVLEKGNEQAVLEVSNLILRDFGFDQQFSREEIYRLYGQRWCDYFAHLLPDTQEELHLQLQHACI